jgi:hypothetical protein
MPATGARSSQAVVTGVGLTIAHMVRSVKCSHIPHTGGTEVRTTPARVADQMSAARPTDRPQVPCGAGSVWRTAVSRRPRGPSQAAATPMNAKIARTARASA